MNRHLGKQKQAKEHKHLCQLILKSFLLKKNKSFSIGKTSVIRKMNFVVVNEVTWKHCCTLQTCIYTAQQQPFTKNLYRKTSKIWIHLFWKENPYPDARKKMLCFSSWAHKIKSENTDIKGSSFWNARVRMKTQASIYGS